jgi:hypothetical protein
VLFALLVVSLVEVIAPSGQSIWIAPGAVTSVRAPRGVEQGHWPPNTRCLLMMLDGKFVVSSERCERVLEKLGAPP